MAFVDVNTGKKISLSKGYESRTITYDEWRRQQEEKRTAGGTDSHGAASPRLGMTGGAEGGTGEAWTRAAPSQTRVPAPKAAPADGIWSRGSRYSGIGSSAAFSQLQRAKKQIHQDALNKEYTQLARQAQQARVDLDTDTLNRVNSRMKEIRAAQGRQTVGDRVNDILSGMFSSYGAGVVNAAGTVVDTLGAVNTRNRNYTTSGAVQAARDNIDYYRAQLSTAKTAEERKRLETLIRSNENKLKLIGEQTEFQESQSRNTAGKIHRLADRMQDDSAKSIASAKEGAGALGQLAVDVGVAGGQMGMDALTAALTGGSALVPMAVRSFGGGAQEARRSGAGLDRQLLYGVGSAALSVGTEKISNIAKPFQKMFGKGAAETIAGSLAKRFGENGAVQLMQRLSKTAAGRIALSAIGEGGEEVVEDVLQPFLKRATFDPNARFDAGEAGNDFLVGAILGGLGGVPEGISQIGSRRGGNRTETGAGAEMRAPAGVETAPETEGVQGIQSGTVEPIKVGRVTTIKRPYQGQTPVQAPKNAAAVQVASGSVERAQNRINGAKGLEDTPIGEPGGFKATLKKKLQESFHPAKGVAVDGVAFAGKPYLVDINNSVVGKVVSDSRLTAEKLALLDVLPDVVKRGEYVGSGEYTAHGGREKPTIRYDYFETPVSINGQNYIAKFDVEVLPGANNYRTHQVIRIDLEQPEARLAGQLPVPSSGEPGPVEGTRPLNSDPTITQPSDSVKPSDDGLGAADAGSLNSDYDRLQAQSAKFHKPGEDSARPVDVPKYDFDGNPVSQTASTVMGAKAIPDDVIPMIEQMVADGKLSYDPVTNAASEARARAKIEQNGFDGAMEEYRSAVRAGKTSPEIEILGQTLLNNAANARDGKAIAELLSLYQAGGTNLGQALQARKVMRKLSPEGQLYAIQRSVYNIDGENIKVSQDLIQKFLDQKDQAGRDAVMVEIVKDVAGQLPGSWGKIFDSMRYLAMLGNTRTHVRNLIGNALFQPLTWGKNRLGGIGEAAAQRAGVDVDRTKTWHGSNPFGKLAREARAEYKGLANLLDNGTHYNEDRTGTRAIREYYNPFKNVKRFQKLADALDWSLGRLGRKNMSILEAEDNLFKTFIYGQTLADYLQANKVDSIDAASPELLSKARNYAAQEALRNTFNDSNVVSDAVAQLGRARQSKNPLIKGVGYAVEGTLPFKRTPANVAVRAVEYSPVGGGVNLIDTIVKGAKKELSPADVSRKIDRIAAGLSGSTLGFLGILAARAGLVTGGDDENEDQRNFNSLTGHQSYAFETENGTSYTLDWAAPASIPFFMGVELYNMAADGRLSQDDLWRSLKNLGSPMLEMSMLQGLNDTFEEAAYAQRHDDSVLAALLARAATGYFTQVFPTAGGQLERIGEDRRMTTYTDKNKSLSTDAQYTLGKISQKVPGWDYSQIPYIDAWGREEETGDVWSRIFQNTASPGYLSNVDVSAVEQELQRIKDATGDSGVFPDRAPKYFNVGKERKDLTAEEYQTYAKKRGQTALEVMGRMASSEGYERLSDEQKAQAVKYAYSYADDLGKMECSDYKPDSGSMAAGVMKSMLTPEVYILYKINSDRDGNGSTSAAESAQTLMEMDGLTDKQKGEAWSAFNNKGETEESRERKEEKNPFTGVLSDEGYSPEEAMAAWGIFDGKGTKEERYTEERKKKDLQEEFGLSLREANDLFALMKRAAGG